MTPVYGSVPGVVTIPQPTTGPTPRLQLNDPATIVGIVATIGAILTKAIPSLAGWHIDSLYPSVALAVTAVYDAWIVGAKHDLAGALVNAVPPVIALAEQVATAIDPGALDALRADVAGLRAQVEAIPTDQRKAALDALSGLTLTGITVAQANTSTTPVTLTGEFPTPPPTNSV